MKPYFEWKSRSADISAVLMMITAIIRFIAYYGKEFDLWFTLSQIVLPYLTVAVFIYAARKRRLDISAVAVDMGVAFFIFKALTFDSVIHTVLCICLYVLVLVIYNLTVFGIIKTKIPLVLSFALPLAEHIIQDIIEIISGADITTYLPELSVLFIMGALLTVALGLKEKNS